MIMAGGTGGHVYPGLAVGRYLREHGARVVWMGTRYGLEAKVIPQEGIDIDFINISGLRGKGLFGWMLLPLRLTLAMTQAARLILRNKPKAILAMGGFASGPGALMAWLLRKPLLIHEQNAVAGFTNRVLSVIASRVLCGFPGAFPARPDAIHVGNPVRLDLFSLAAPEQRLESHSGQLRILVIGGSQGAQFFNKIIPAAIAAIPEAKRPQVIHQAGPRWLEETKACYSNLISEQQRIEVKPFIENMKEAYDWADVIVCRSGAMTVAEVAAVGLAAILVPFPSAVDDHQTANARFLADRDAAVLIQERDLSAERLAEMFMELHENRQVILEMSQKARSCAMPDATEHVANLCMEVMNA